MNESEFRKIPGVDELLESVSFPDGFPRPLRKHIISSVLEGIRESVKNGNRCPERSELEDRIKMKAKTLGNNRVRSVLNATGVVLHTNLGRAPFSEQALRAFSEVTSGYSNLEIDLSTGERGGRGLFGEQLLCQMTGAEEAGVVNNCSGALVLALKAIAKGRDVLISRGELVQIGGGFRIPEVLEASGSSLREVGTTNKTSIDDYRKELDDEVGMILRVHRSNFDLVGFTDSPSHGALAEVAKDAGVPFLCDLGSGAVWDTREANLKEELRPRTVLGAGTDLVTFSGDKLLGGPQAGIFLGNGAYVETMKAHPFFRALRCGKATLTVLESTLDAYARGDETSVPALRQLKESPDELEERVRSTHDRLSYPEGVKVTSMEGRVGGGSLPRERLESWGFVLDPPNPESVVSDLRELDPPIIARLRNGEVLLNFRTILPRQESILVDGLDSLLPLSGS